MTMNLLSAFSRAFGFEPGQEVNVNFEEIKNKVLTEKSDAQKKTNSAMNAALSTKPEDGKLSGSSVKKLDPARLIPLEKNDQSPKDSPEASPSHTPLPSPRASSSSLDLSGSDVSDVNDKTDPQSLLQEVVVVTPEEVVVVTPEEVVVVTPEEVVEVTVDGDSSIHSVSKKTEDQQNEEKPLISQSAGKTTGFGNSLAQAAKSTVGIAKGIVGVFGNFIGSLVPSDIDDTHEANSDSDSDSDSDSSTNNSESSSSSSSNKDSQDNLLIPLQTTARATPPPATTASATPLPATTAPATPPPATTASATTASATTASATTASATTAPATTLPPLPPAMGLKLPKPESALPEKEPAVFSAKPDAPKVSRPITSAIQGEELANAVAKRRKELAAATKKEAAKKEAAVNDSSSSSSSPTEPEKLNPAATEPEKPTPAATKPKKLTSAATTKKPGKKEEKSAVVSQPQDLNKAVTGVLAGLKKVEISKSTPSVVNSDPHSVITNGPSRLKPRSGSVVSVAPKAVVDTELPSSSSSVVSVAPKAVVDTESSSSSSSVASAAPKAVLDTKSSSSSSTPPKTLTSRPTADPVKNGNPTRVPGRRKQKQNQIYAPKNPASPAPIESTTVAPPTAVALPTAESETETETKN